MLESRAGSHTEPFFLQFCATSRIHGANRGPAADGDEDRLESRSRSRIKELFRRHATRAEWRPSRSPRVRDPEGARDLTSRVLEKALRRCEQCRVSLPGWMRGSARSEVSRAFVNRVGPYPRAATERRRSLSRGPSRERRFCGRSRPCPGAIGRSSKCATASSFRVARSPTRSVSERAKRLDQSGLATLWRVRAVRQSIVGRVAAAVPCARRGKRGTAEEQATEDRHAVGDLDAAAVVGVRGVETVDP